MIIPTSRGDIRALLDLPDNAQWLYIFAHGAGAGMQHAFMEAAATALNDRGIATLRYDYPYMSAGSRRPDRAPVLETNTRDVVTFAAETWPALRIAAGGKSMGGRMTSRAQASDPLPRVEALVFVGFPLHPPGKPSIERAEHLASVDIPMLFLQGTRDDLAHLELIRGVTDELGPRATLHIVEGADHGFAVLKRSGRTGPEVLDELADTTAAFLEGLR
ncbi:MAG TPA: alpha/beta family hydrolase [Longimicrobiales bacterium]|nr:alpha/beta family hydrolase [Longimicrobiales bacterium]